jgi:PAS domain S-box-containing protein
MSEGHVEPPNLSGNTLTADRLPKGYTQLDFVNCLNHDQRPSFLLYPMLDNLANRFAGALAFCNSALLQCGHLHGLVARVFSGPSENLRPEEDAFLEWILNQSKRSGLELSKVFSDTLWTVTLLPEGWLVVSGLELGRCDFTVFNDAAASRNAFWPRKTMSQDCGVESSAGLQNDVKVISELDRPTSTSKNVWPPIGLGDSAHIAWIREFDWKSTSLGPAETWPVQLKQACEIMLANPDPATVFWGRDLILIYNEAYIALAGNKHPSMMGGSARVYWREVWDQYDPLFDQMFIDGKVLKEDNSRLLIQRSGYLEEGFFNLRVMPILGDDGSVVGFYEPVSEVTKQNLSERRMHMLLSLSERTSSASSLPDLWPRLLKTLNGYPLDIYFAALYCLHRQKKTTACSRYNLEGVVGLASGSVGFCQMLDICDSDKDSSDLNASIRRAHESGSSVLLTTSDKTLSASILCQLEGAGLTEAPNACIICPLSSSVDVGSEAFLILGTSPRRPYDDDYEVFINLLASQIESTITSAKLLEVERERHRQQAVYESELKFKKFAENAPVGIFSFDPVGNVTFCNESWLELSGHDRNNMSAMSWTGDVHPDNAAEIKGYWDKIVNFEGPQTFEVQYKKPWKPKNLTDDSISLDRTWVVASAYAEVSDEGDLTGILGCVTDVSSFKWVDQLQSQRLSEALEMKRQQENFLDITSHEMRNPLNAILHCAAEVVELLPGLARATSASEREAVLRDCLDASRTIVYCGRHQKRIIDDVLTLSKLDSNLLSISPVETNPLDVVEKVLGVFDTEIRASSIKTKTELADSYKALAVDTLLVDPYRLSQILINLVANAVKFTKGESLRSLHVVIEAHNIEPVSLEHGVRYVPSGRRPTDPTVHPEWGTGEVVFLHFSVQDTGPGMSRPEADLLFNRFAQGSPRTHVQYGGSGLGLFISRELAELHGGRIGISSELGYGSTFDFYVKGRRPEKNRGPNPSNDACDSATPVLKLEDQIPAEPAASTPVTEESAHGVKKNPIISSDVHVLIVEDNLINQKILAKLIRKQGWSVTVANHGEEALVEINASAWHNSVALAPSPQKAKLDIVLADIEMPVMNGKEFIRHVRRLQSDGVLSDVIPVVAVTGYARVEQIQQAKECGFNEVVSKPYREDEIIATVLKYTKMDVA